MSKDKTFKEILVPLENFKRMDPEPVEGKWITTKDNKKFKISLEPKNKNKKKLF